MFRVAAVLVLLLGVSTSAVQGARFTSTDNPVSRVVELLQGMSKKVEEDGKAEEELFEKYVCWYKEVTSTKSAANEAAATRVRELKSHVDDIEGGKIEFTSERGDLTKQLSELNSELETSKGVREKEHEDFLAAKEEMEKAIAALEEAVVVMKDGGGKGGSLISVKADLVKSLENAEKELKKYDFSKVVGLAEHVLSANDARFLAKVLDGQMSASDWKKLDSFKLKYKGKDEKIQEILKDMLQTFKDNLEEAEQKEKDAQSFYEKLTASKTAERDSVQDSSADMAKENAARQLAKEEAQHEMEELTKQQEEDSQFLAETEEAYKTKSEEWSERKRLRGEELSSISKAIGILQADDARDTFSKSSLGGHQRSALVVQKKVVEQPCSELSRLERAAMAMRRVAMELGSLKMYSLASQAVTVSSTSAGHFDKVVKDLDKQIERLKKDDEKDLKDRDACVEDRKAKTNEAKKYSQEIDDNNSLIERKKDAIAAQEKRIKDTDQEIKDTEKELVEATELRKLENTAYKANKAVDQEALTLIKATKNTLKRFYKENGLALAKKAVVVQKKKDTKKNRKVQETTKKHLSAAQQAPPPPPATWSEPYGGAKGESEGVQGLMDLILEDTKKDIKEADQIEADTQKAFDKMKDETKAAIESLHSENADTEITLSRFQKEVTETTEQNADTHGSLDASMSYLKGISPSCDYITVNFELRKRNRWAERDGLEKAKAVLQGAKESGFLQKPVTC